MTTLGVGVSLTAIGIGLMAPNAIGLSHHFVAGLIGAICATAGGLILLRRLQ